MFVKAVFLLAPRPKDRSLGRAEQSQLVHGYDPLGRQCDPYARGPMDDREDVHTQLANGRNQPLNEALEIDLASVR